MCKKLALYGCCQNNNLCRHVFYRFLFIPYFLGSLKQSSPFFSLFMTTLQWLHWLYEQFLQIFKLICASSIIFWKQLIL